jgi:hypothetical protein
MTSRIILSAFGLSFSTFGLAVSLYSNQSQNVNIPQLNVSTTSLSGVVAPNGIGFSELQSTGASGFQVANTVAGFNPSTNWRLADDFTVTGGGWTVNSICVYAYASANGPWTGGGELNIWSAEPGSHFATLVATTRASVMTDTFQNDLGMGRVSRIFNTNPSNGEASTTKLLQQFSFDLGSVNLAAGTYWIDYQLIKVGGGFIYTPSTTHAGQRGVAGANARQKSGAAWEEIFDDGIVPLGSAGVASPVLQDIPFLVKGEPVPEPATMIALSLGIAGILKGRRRSFRS